MKLKTWCSVVLLVIAALLVMSILIIDKVAFDVAAIVGELICVLILTKYSKICD